MADGSAAWLRKTSDPARLADLHDRVAAAERRLRDIRDEIDVLRDGMVGEHEIKSALSDFDGLWAAMSPKEQARVIQLLVEKVVYDGAAGTVSVTFLPSGIRALEGVLDEREAAA